MNQKFILIISIIIGIIACIICRSWITMKNEEFAQLERELNEKNAVDYVEIIAANGRLAKGRKIGSDDIGVRKMPKQFVTKDMILRKDFRYIENRELKNSLEDKAPLKWSDIVGHEFGVNTLAEKLKDGERAVSIPISGAAGVSGMVNPNDCVDIIGSFTLPAENGNPDETELVTLTVLQNITVLATGNESFTGTRTARQSNYNSVTLLVTPEQAELLVFTQQIKGRLSLALRRRGDTKTPDLPRIDFKNIETHIKKYK